jgi:hypothetical protein
MGKGWFSLAMAGFVSLFLGSAASAQQWAKAYGGPEDDYAKSIQQTFDGGYIVAGNTRSFGAGAQDFWVLKLDGSGNLQWQKTYGRKNDDWANSIQQTTDGGYVVAGKNQPDYPLPYGTFWVLKLDGSGNVQWQSGYIHGAASSAGARSIQQTSDGGYVVAGYIMFSSFPYDYELWVLKLDDRGNVQWQKTYGTSNWEGANSIQQTSDGGYIVAGYTHDWMNPDFWVLKLDGSGNVQWQKTFGMKYNDGANSIQQTSDGGYIVVGGAYILKLDDRGNVHWQKTYWGGAGETAYSIQKTTDGGYIVAGYTDSFGAGNSDLWVLKLDKEGNIPGCPLQGKSTVEVKRTNVSGVNTYVSGNGNASYNTIKTSATITDTAVSPTEICYAVIDLTGEWIALRQTCRETVSGLKCKLKGTLRVDNEGNVKGGSGAFVHFYLSSDQNWDSEDVLLKQVALGTVKPAKSKTKKLRVSLPPGETASGKYVIAWIDATEMVQEGDENNNFVLSDQIP